MNLFSLSFCQLVKKSIVLIFRVKLHVYKPYRCFLPFVKERCLCPVFSAQSQHNINISRIFFM